jgi:hypothetical protein
VSTGLVPLSPSACPSLRTVAVGALAVDLVGGLVARRSGLEGEPFLVVAPTAIPGPVLLLGWGTALSGPLLADAALVAFGHAADRGSQTMCRPVRWLGLLRLVGVLCEPVTWGRRRPRWTMALSGAQLVVACSLIRCARTASAAMTEGGQ